MKNKQVYFRALDMRSIQKIIFPGLLIRMSIHNIYYSGNKKNKTTTKYFGMKIKHHKSGAMIFIEMN